MAVSTVKVNINGTDYNLTYNGSTSKWEATITAPGTTSFNQAGGYYACTVTATDQAGNVTTKNSADATLGPSLRLDVTEKVKPTIALTAPSGGARVVTSTPSITFQLRDEAGGSGVKISTLALKIDGGAAITNGSAGLTATPVTNGYDCTYVPQSALAEGAHSITIDIQDNDGNAATQASSSFNVDTAPPALNITAPANSLITNNANCTVSGTTNDTTSSPVTVTIKLNGVDQGAVTVTAGSFSKSITLASGANTIIIRSTDAAGLYTEITRTVTLDTTPPTISVVTITPNPVDAGATFTISVTVSDT